jgi:hypothetical protein
MKFNIFVWEGEYYNQVVGEKKVGCVKCCFPKDRNPCPKDSKHQLICGRHSYTFYFTKIFPIELLLKEVKNEL